MIHLKVTQICINIEFKSLSQLCFDIGKWLNDALKVNKTPFSIESIIRIIDSLKVSWSVIIELKFN